MVYADLDPAWSWTSINEQAFHIFMNILLFKEAESYIIPLIDK